MTDNTTNRRLNETLTVRVGAVGVAGEGLGIASVAINLDTMDDQAIGKVMADGFRAAHTEAIREFGPVLSAAWAQQPQRIREGDQSDSEKTDD